MKRQRKSGNTGHRLALTKAESPEIHERRRKVRRPNPVTVIRADGSREVRSADSFTKGRR